MSYDWFTWYKNLETGEVIGDDCYGMLVEEGQDVEDWIEISPEEAKKIHDQQELDDLNQNLNVYDSVIN